MNAFDLHSRCCSARFWCKSSTNIQQEVTWKITSGRREDSPEVDAEGRRAIWLEALLLIGCQFLIRWMVLFSQNLKISPPFSTSGLAIPGETKQPFLSHPIY